MKKFFAMLCALLMVVSLLSGFAGASAYNETQQATVVVPVSEDGMENLAYIYAFLTDDNHVDLNPAAAAGVISIIYMESGPNFDPTTTGMFAWMDGTLPYGLFQWSGHQRELMEYWCESINQTPDTCRSQMLYWEHDMKVHHQNVLVELRAISNDEEGAAEAAVLVAKYYCGYTPRLYDSLKARAAGFLPLLQFAAAVQQGI